MKTVIIYSDQITLFEMTGYLNKYGAEILGVFSSPTEGYEFVLRQKPDIVFLNTVLPVISGIDLGIMIRSHLPNISIVYYTSFPEYALEAFKAHPADYIVRPSNENRFFKTIDYIKENLRGIKKEDQSLPVIRCFGKFEVLIGDEEVHFSTQKTRELFAFLICHNDQHVFKEDMLNIIFSTGDEKREQNNFRVTLYRLKQSLAKADLFRDHVLIKDDCSLEMTQGICDYKDFCDFVRSNKVISDHNIGKAQEVIDSIRGDLLSDIDAFWVIEFREFAATQTEELMIKTAQYYMASGNEAMAESILLRLIELNCLSEQGHSNLLDHYIHKGNKDKFLFHYKRFNKILKNELGASPEKKYIRYYLECSDYI